MDLDSQLATWPHTVEVSQAPESRVPVGPANRHGCPPDHEDKAIELVLQQAELFANGEAA